MIMSTTFSIKRREHLAQWAKKKGILTGGYFRGREYDHILANGKEDSDKNLSDGLKFDLLLKEDLHMYTHHLNSSQILCYNYFRPMINSDRTPKKELQDLMKSLGVAISNRATCHFEYKCKDDGTSFDFHIQDGKIEVFVEVKYTEDSFGTAKADDKTRSGITHKEKFQTIYRPMLQKCSCLRKNNISAEFFCKNYQLFRNVIRIQNANMFTLFIYPKGHTSMDKKCKSFINENIKEDYKDNVQIVYWDNLIKEGSDLFDKYLAN